MADYKSIPPIIAKEAISADDLLFGANGSQSTGTPTPFAMQAVADWITEHGSGAQGQGGIQYINSGNASVNNSTSLIVIDKSGGAATTLTLGAASARMRLPLIIAQWSGFEGDVTVTAFGSDVFNGTFSTFTIPAATGQSGGGWRLSLIPVDMGVAGWIAGNL